MPDILTTLDIDAPPHRVWPVLVDTAAFDEWNPFMTRVKGRLAPGEPMEFMVPLGKRDMAIDAELLVVDEPTELRWRGPRNALLGKLFRGEHYLTLEPLEGDRTRLTHGEKFAGVIPSLAWKRLEQRLLPLYTAMNEALKRRVEAER